MKRKRTHRKLALVCVCNGHSMPFTLDLLKLSRERRKYGGKNIFLQEHTGRVIKSNYGG